jgi:hypothetical protein
MAALGLSLSTVAVIAVAQQRPNEFHGVASDDATVRERATAPTVRFAETSAVDDARIATSHVVSSTSEKFSVATAPGHHRVPMVTDWSTKHVVFAKPRTEKDAARLEHNTRYKMQIYRRNAAPSRKLVDAKFDGANLLDRFRNRVQDPHPIPAKADPVKRDWSVPLNGNGTSSPTPSVGNNQFPAKYTFDVNAPPDCTNDFVVYNTNTNLLVAFNNLYSGTDLAGNPNGICTDGDGNLLSAPTVMWAYTINAYTTGVTSTSVTLSLDGTQVAVVESSPTQGSVLHIVKWSLNDGGTIAAPFPLYEYNDWTGDTNDWFNNCGGNGVNGGCSWTVFFAPDEIYTLGNPGDVKKAGRIRPNDYFSQHPASDTNSAPYYDYFNDIIYVGTDQANLHQFINVFNGATLAIPKGPSESTLASGTVWPIYMNTTTNPALTGPIEDAASGRIFVSDEYGDLLFIETGNVPGIAGECRDGSTNYPCLAMGYYASGANGIPDPPVVDSSLGTVLVFAGGDKVHGDADDAFAAQALTTSTCVCGDGKETDGNFVFADFGPVSGAGTGTHMHSGDFDNNYYTSDGTPGSVAGYMYVCAIDPNGATGGGKTALRQISIGTDGLISGVSSSFLKVATDSSDECSPVTEVYNPNTLEDLMFFSVHAHSYACAADPALGTGGWPVDAPAGGCLMSVDVTNDVSVPGFFPVAFAAHLAEDGGTSGIIIDNISSEAQASSIYFTPLGDTDDPGNTCTFVGCAVKATQVGLQ